MYWVISARFTIVGKMYVRAPVSSNMMTTTVTVIRMIPLRSIQLLLLEEQVTYDKAAAAPRKAYVPGVIQGLSGSQAANKAA